MIDTDRRQGTGEDPAPITGLRHDRDSTDVGGGIEGAARAVSVRTGRGTGERVEVIGELNEGDIVVVRGNERLMPGQPVVVETSDARVSSQE